MATWIGGRTKPAKAEGAAPPFKAGGRAQAQNAVNSIERSAIIERSQNRIALVAAASSFVLAISVIVVMGFAEYQNKFETSQLGVRRNEVMKLIEIENDLDNSASKLEEKRDSLRKIVREFQTGRAELAFHIDRICSDFVTPTTKAQTSPTTSVNIDHSPATNLAIGLVPQKKDEPTASGSSSASVTTRQDDGFEDTPCHAFLRLIPFDETLGELSSTKAISDADPKSRDAFADAVARALADKLGISDKDQILLPYYKRKFLHIAERNQYLYGKLYIQYRIENDEYFRDCIRFAELWTNVQYKERLQLPNCNIYTIYNTIPLQDLPDTTTTTSISGASVATPIPYVGTIDKSQLDAQDLRFNLVNQFRIYSSSWIVPKMILLSSPEVLTQCLLIIGGALGAMLKILFLHLTPQRKITWSALLIEPAQGCVCAIVLYVLFRSGVVLVSGGAERSGGGSTLSPFFVAFIAIGAGILSEEVVALLRRAAGNVITSASARQPERWAVGLKEALAASVTSDWPMSPAALASRLDVPPQRVTTWADCDDVVDPDNQAKIALVLGVPAFRLFTDIRPTNPQSEIADDDNGAEGTTATTQSATGVANPNQKTER